VTTVLGRDLATKFANRFAGRLASATFTKWTAGGVNPSDPAGPPLGSSAMYSCDAIALAYEERFVDGETILKGDYQVVVLLGSIKLGDVLAPGVVPNPGDSISCPPPNQTTPVTGAVVSIVAVTAVAITCQVRGAGI
jgi:hypothetical protein